MTATETGLSARGVLTELRATYPDSPFLALGQTVFWDEPLKAVLRRLLDDFELGGQMILGVHDTDYFAKAHIRAGETGRFALLPHNDGTTRDLWSAAGEISTLFGSETFPSRHDLVRNGVALGKVLAANGPERTEFIDRVTEAWGWRGLVYTGSRDLIVSRLPLKEVGDGILEMLMWGFESALDQIAPGCCRDEARAVGEKILTWCRDYRAANPDKFLTHLYQHVLPRFYCLLLGNPPENVLVSGTSDLLRLAPETAHLNRFKFVDLFLDPATRDSAIDAYNQAVHGSEIYTLDKFGPGALPFDIVTPQAGRGTLRVTPRVVFIEGRQPVAIGLKKPVESIHDLAEVLAHKFGPDVILVGKAVSLVSMFAQEFIFVFNEEGSMYVRRTRQMNDIIARSGIALDMRPLLRLRYETWDSLSVGQSTLCPTEHLVAAFGQPKIATPEFAATWRTVVAEQRALCERLKTIKKTRHLIEFLQQREPSAPWEEHKQAYITANQTLIRLRKDAEHIQNEVGAHYARLRAIKAALQATQLARGEHFRSVTEWTESERSCRARFAEDLHRLEAERGPVAASIQLLKRARKAIERSDEALQARAVRLNIESEAETARLRLVRYALLTIEGLEHTNHRPSAWWLPMLNASGEWFGRIADTATLYTDPLLS